MRKMLWRISLLAVCLALLLPTALIAQNANQEQQPIYAYVSEWSVPRQQWPDMDKLEQSDRALMDKLLASGTIIGYGAYVNLIHQEGEPTHGSWFTATSEGNLLKALEAVYAEPGQTNAPVQAASKHWDRIYEETIYKAKSGSSSGYLTVSAWQVKPGEARNYRELYKSTFVPVLDKLFAEGAITAYGLMGEDYHQGKVGMAYDYITVPDAASLDKVNKAMDEVFKNPAIGSAFRSAVEPGGHRDFLTRLSFMKSK